MEPKPDNRAALEAKYRPPVELQRSVDAVEEVLMASSRRWQRFPDRYGVEIELRRWASRVDWLASNYDYLLDADFLQMQLVRLGLENFMETAEEMGLDDFLIWMVRLVDEVDEKFRYLTSLDTVGLAADDERWVPSYWFLRRLPHDESVLETLQLRGPLTSTARTRRRVVTRVELEPPDVSDA